MNWNCWIIENWNWASFISGCIASTLIWVLEENARLLFSRIWKRYDLRHFSKQERLILTCIYDLGNLEIRNDLKEITFLPKKHLVLKVDDYLETIQKLIRNGKIESPSSNAHANVSGFAICRGPFVQSPVQQYRYYNLTEVGRKLAEELKSVGLAVYS
jgi:hypothetical protein